MDKLNFKMWFEDKTHSLESNKDKKKDKPENYLDGMSRELGIDPNLIPDYIESGPIHLDEEGLWFNQAIWKVIKPIRLKDHFVKIQFHKSLSPNLDQNCYIKGEDGKMIPYNGDVTNKTFLITINKLANMLSKGWQGALQNPTNNGGM